MTADHYAITFANAVYLRWRYHELLERIGYWLFA